MVYLVRHHICTGDLKKAAYTLATFRRLCATEDAPPVIGIREKMLSVIYFIATCKHGQCFQAMSEGLALSRMSGIHIMDSIILENAALSAIISNDLKVARELLDTVAASLNTLDHYSFSYFHLIKSLEALCQKSFTHSVHYARQALEFTENTGAFFEQGLSRLLNAQCLYNTGKQPEAFKHLAHAFRIAEKMKSSILESNALFIKAHFALDQENETLALTSLKKAFEIGRAKGHVMSDQLPVYVMAKLCAKALEAGIEEDLVIDHIRKRNLIPDKAQLYLENWPWPIKIYTLGRVAIEKDGVPIKFSAKTPKKPLDMIKTLFVLGGHDVNKELVCDALWQDAEGYNANRAFKTTLHRARRILGNNVTNSGVIEALGCTLTMGGDISNSSGDLITASSGNKLLMSKGLTNNNGGGFLIPVENAPVPVPPAILLFGTGLLGLIAIRRRVCS